MSNFVRVHDATYIRAAKRLYMTATPRVYGEAVRDVARDVSTAEQKSAIRRRKTRPSCYMPGGVA